MCTIDDTGCEVWDLTLVSDTDEDSDSAFERSLGFEQNVIDITRPPAHGHRLNSLRARSFSVSWALALAPAPKRRRHK